MKTNAKNSKADGMLRSTEGIKTCRAILDLLKLQASDAGTLAKRLKVTGMAVRQHLYQLCDEKLVTYSESPRPVGRPSKIWTLTPEAAKFFPDAHASLALTILDNVKNAFGPDSISKLLEVRAEQQITAYNQALSHAVSLKDRLKVLAKLRSEEGYMAELISESDGSFLLLEHHCPICSAASSCRGLCDAELKVFQAVLKNLAQVQRVDHILAGANRCAYRVVPD